MNTGKETWKWGVVVLLLAVFLITANQAYQHIANQEDFEAPDDYLKGDSWDLEHGGGPGAGQPIQITNDYNRSQTTPAPVGTSNSELSNSSTGQEPIVLDDNVNWNQSDSDSNQAPKSADSTVKNQKQNNNTQSGMYEIFSTPSVKETTPSSSEEKAKENPASNNTETKQGSVPEPAKQEVPTEEKTSEAIPAETPAVSTAEPPAEAPVNNQTPTTAEVPAEAPTVVPAEVPAQPANETKTNSEPAAEAPSAQ